VNDRAFTSRFTGPVQLLAAYVLTLAATIGIILLICLYGEKLIAPAPETTLAATITSENRASDPLIHVLLALAAVIVVGKVFARLFVYLGQPPVMAEIVAGIFLGPSILGWIAPAISNFILPPGVAPYLGVIAQLGVILYMFLVGLELNPRLLRQRGHATVFTSHISIIVPFVLGAALALILYPRLSDDEVPFTSFALFLAVAMSITAFGVLARILTDRRTHKTELGVMALTCAAITDVTAWCLLAFVVGIAQARIGSTLWVAVCTLTYIAFMFLLVKPMAKRYLAPMPETQVSPNVVAAVLVALLLSALITEWIGVHAAFGAFLLGAVVPHDSAVARTFTRHLEDLVTILLLPAFFAFTGMRTHIGLVTGLEQWLLWGLIFVVASAGKVGGTVLPARLSGVPWREASALGILLNTRGLMEVIVLNIGLDLKIISPALFAMMVLMALVNALITSPALLLLKPNWFFRTGTSGVAETAQLKVESRKIASPLCGQ
jgi:Kef-type K+ transport system membrane component KefB